MHNLPSLRRSTDRDNSSTARGLPTIDGQSRGPEPGCRVHGSPNQDGDRSAPAGSETQSSTGTQALAIPGLDRPAFASARANHRDTVQTTARNCQSPSPLDPRPLAHRAPATEAAESRPSTLSILIAMVKYREELGLE